MAEYVVHIYGPDDVIPQPDRATAVREAHAINADIVALGEKALNDPYSPTVWAVVEERHVEP